jgi:hypothetical protein
MLSHIGVRQFLNSSIELSNVESLNMIPAPYAPSEAAVHVRVPFDSGDLLNDDNYAITWMHRLVNDSRVRQQQAWTFHNSIMACISGPGGFRYCVTSDVDERWHQPL